MKCHHSSVPTVALSEALFRRPAVTDGTGILLLNGQWQGIPTWCQEILGDAISEIETITGLKAHHVSVNVIVPRGGSGWHADPTPQDEKGQSLYHDRWHLPLRTNAKCWFEDDEHERFHMALGWWWGPVKYWLLHAVGNDGDQPRMHLIVDLR